MQDLLNGLHGRNVFSKMDLVKGYHQISVAAADISKTAIITLLACLSICSRHLDCLTLHRLFSEWWTALLMVLRVCLHTWMTLMWVLQTGKHTFFIWKIFSMLWRPMALPSTLRNAFLQSPPWKFLATRFRQQDRSPQPVMPPHFNIPPPPEDIKQLQRFLSTVIFYRRFLPNCAQVLHPLTDLLKGGD